MTAGRSGRILAVLPDHPYPLDMGSRVRNLRLLEALAGSFDLTIVTMLHDPRRMQDPGPVAKLGRWVPILAPHRRGIWRQVAWHVQAHWSAAVHGLHHETFFLSLPPLSRVVARLVAEEHPDLVHAAYWYTLRRLRRFPRPPLWVVDTHDVQFERHERLWGRRSPRERREELGELARYDRVIAITERDRATLADLLPAGAPPIEVVPMGLDLDFWRAEKVAPALPPAPRIAFYGNLSTEFNQQGALHFLRDLLPAVRSRLPEAEALIIGASPPAQIRRAAEASGATVTGYVEDVRPWIRAAGVVALSIQAGSGQRGRVVEALALGVPVVGYPAALDGLDLFEGEGIQTARDAEDFVERLARLVQDPGTASALGAAGRARVEERYSNAATYGLLPALYRRMLGQGTGCGKAPDGSRGLGGE